MSSSSNALASPYVLGRQSLMILLAGQALLLVVAVLFPLSVLAAVGIVLGLAVLLLGPTIPLFLFYATTVVSSLDFSGQIAEVGTLGLAITYFQVAFAITFVFFLASRFLYQRFDFPRTSVNAPLLLFIAMCGISLIYGVDLERGLIKFVRIHLLSLFMYMAVILIDNRRRLNVAVGVLLGNIFLLACLSISQIVLARSLLPSPMERVLGYGVRRSEGTFTDPNTFASFLQLGVIVGLALLINGKLRRAVKILVVGGVACTSVGMLATFSRAGWVSAVLGLIALMLLTRRFSTVLKLLAAFLVILMLAVIVFPFITDLMARFTSIFEAMEDVSSSSRVYLAISGLQMFRDNLIGGVGWGGYQAAYPQYRHPEMLLNIDYCHTLPVTIMAELGLIGIVLALWLIVAILREGRLGIKAASDDNLKAVGLGLVAGLVAVLVSTLFSGNTFDNHMWLVMGLILAFHRVARSEQPAATSVLEGSC